MEQIYTIPVNEAFDRSLEKPECGCPFCTLYRKLQSDELGLILGASMMEPDIRIMTNDLGFCADHYGAMMKRKRMLGIGLILESHLAETEKKLDRKSPPVIGPAGADTSELLRLETTCYVCSRIAKNLGSMIATAVYLWESDAAFREKFAKQPWFCLPHYRMMTDYAQKKMNKRTFREFLAVAHGIEKTYIATLSGDVSWFCKKFDYRYDEEPWYNAKDALPRAIRFLVGDRQDDEKNSKGETL